MFRFIDSSLPFRIHKRKLSSLNIYQFLIQRYGIGSKLATLLINHSGYKKELSARLIRSSFISNNVRKFFVQNISFLDKNLKEYMLKRIGRYIKIGCYKGVRHVFFYPSRGQRTRSNARTRKLLRKLS